MDSNSHPRDYKIINSTASATEDCLLREHAPESLPTGSTAILDAIRRLRELSPTQLKVAELMAAGLSAPQVARALFVSTDTVYDHQRKIAEKLGVPRRLIAAIVYASHLGSGVPCSTNTMVDE